MKHTIEYRVRRSEENETLIDFVARTLAVSKKTAKSVLDLRNVSVNGNRVWMARHALAAGDIVDILRPTVDSVRRAPPPPVPILFHDAHYVVAAKPAGVLSCGPKSLEPVLRRQLNLPVLQAAHRLDRETSGCLMFACTSEAFDRIVMEFRSKTVAKVYHAIVHGRMRSGEHRISKPIGGQTAVSNARVLDASSKATHVAIGIETGRTHQIRIHLASIRHPVLGDRKYATAVQLNENMAAVPRQMLHAHSLRFVHPFTGGSVRVTAPLPPEFRQTLKAFNLS